MHPYDPANSFVISELAVNANQFEDTSTAKNSVPSIFIWNTALNVFQRVSTKDNVVLEEFSAGEGVKVFRAQLTSDLSPVAVAMTILENTISGTAVLTKTSPGRYNLQFGTEISPTPLPVNKTQLTQNGTFSGIFIQNFGGDILDAGLARYLRIDDFNVAISTFYVGLPPADDLLADHSVVIIVVP